MRVAACQCVIQAKVDPEGKPGFFAIASPPDVNNQGVLELLVKRQPGTAADAICDLAEGSELKVSPVMVRQCVACLNGWRVTGVRCSALCQGAVV